eukprot:m.10121 g.10121  ORF g.10121 m.10121 type:complete len:381 (+) comp4203_c0_seq2:166-1308(+)
MAVNTPKTIRRADAKNIISAEPVSIPSIGMIKDALPTKVFEKKLGTSLFYFALDFALFLLSLLCLRYVMGETRVPETTVQIAVMIMHWMVGGFYMWCLFVVGHDCGHGTFSTSTLINDICGHITHGFLLVPYYPWQTSHRRHHMFHNHVEKDYSHPWYDAAMLESIEKNGASLAKMYEDYPILRTMYAIIGWPLYLYAGFQDGSHLIPDSQSRLWKAASQIEFVKGIVSSTVVVLYFALVFFAFCNADWVTMLIYYLIPLGVFGWWIFTVTYLQHHGHTSLVYNDNNWSFVKAGFETIDRRYGFGIDELHHHISDGHVVHHLFSTKIPHYNLPEATKSLTTYLSKNGYEDLYKYESTKDFGIRVFQQLFKKGFHATLVKE